MELIPVAKCITVYPVKSLDGVLLQKAQIGNGGCLLHDREYAIRNSKGKFINGKSNSLVHVLRSEVDFENEIISFRHESDTSWNRFHLQKEKQAVDTYLSEFFNEEAVLAKNPGGRFLDIPDFSGITVLSTASLESVSIWFDDMDIEETRKRFRATIEIDNVPAFWEDHLFAEAGTAIEFTIGDVTLMGMSPRARCIVPTRHPQTGEVIHAFPKTFAKHRAELAPSWSGLDEYGHHYYLSVDCFIPSGQTGKWICTGDSISLTGNKFTHKTLGF